MPGRLLSVWLLSVQHIVEVWLFTVHRVLRVLCLSSVPPIGSHHALGGQACPVLHLPGRNSPQLWILARSFGAPVLATAVERRGCNSGHHLLALEGPCLLTWDDGQRGVGGTVCVELNAQLELVVPPACCQDGGGEMVRFLANKAGSFLHRRGEMECWFEV